MCRVNDNGNNDIMRSGYEPNKWAAARWNVPRKSFVDMVARHCDQM